MLDRVATAMTTLYSGLMHTWLTVIAALGISAGVALNADEPISQFIPLLGSWVLLFAIFLGWSRFSRPDRGSASRSAGSIPVWTAGLTGVAVFMTLLVRLQPVGFAALSTGVIVVFVAVALVAWDRFLTWRQRIAP